MIRFSFANQASGSSLATSTTFTEAETGVGLRFPERPHLRGFTADLTGGRVTLDFGTATSLGVIALINANFTAATVQGNATDAWGSPSYTQAITIGPSATDRYNYALRPVAFNYRYCSILVPTGTATDGLTRFALGGIWAGAITSPPRDIRMEPTEDPIEAYEDIKTDDGRLLQRIVLDDPAFNFTATRQAENESDLAAWRTIDRTWRAASGQMALVLLRDSYAEEVFIGRIRSTSKWRHSKAWPESDIELSEVTAG